MGDAVRGMFLTDILGGMKITLRHLLTKKITVQYPEQRRPVAPRWRGMHQFMLDDNGRELCVACGMCAGVCPSQCIDVLPGEREDGTRYPERYSINVARCVYCGFCQEVCPYFAIKLTTHYETKEPSRDKLVYNKQDLITPKWEREGEKS